MYKKLLLIITACALYSCGGEKQQPSTLPPIPEPEKVIEDNTLVISSFDTLPDEIEGCSCIFRADSVGNKNTYLFASKYGGNSNFSYMMVNGKLLRLTESEHTDTDSTASFSVYKADDIEVELDIRHSKVNEETESSDESGTLTVKQSDGQTIKKAIYGSCGC